MDFLKINNILTMDNGLIICLKDMAMKYSKMVISSKVNSSKVKDVEKVIIIGNLDNLFTVKAISMKIICKEIVLS